MMAADFASWRLGTPSKMSMASWVRLPLTMNTGKSSRSSWKRSTSPEVKAKWRLFGLCSRSRAREQPEGFAFFGKDSSLRKQPPLTCYFTDVHGEPNQPFLTIPTKAWARNWHRTPATDDRDLSGTGESCTPVSSSLSTLSMGGSNDG